MASHGIKDRVAIVGMGCTTFGEHWDRSADDLLVDATEECFASTPAISKDDVDAFWLGTMASGQSGLTLSRPLALDYKPVTRVENFCATGSEAFRNACYAVASWCVRPCDGRRRREAQGLRLLRARRSTTASGDGTVRERTAPAVVLACSIRRTATSTASTPTTMRDAMTHIAWKNHSNGAKNPRAQFRKEVAEGEDRRGAAGRRARSASSTARASPTGRRAR